MLRPPDDPFLCYGRLVDSKCWPKRAFFEQTDTDFKSILMEEILKLVRTTFTSQKLSLTSGFFDDHHAEFLRLKCRWDEKLQIYVRGDGTYTLDTFND